jgi:hypothetical protein
VLKPGGKLALGIWDKPEMNEATEVLKSISTLLPAPPADAPGPFALSEDGRIEASCSIAGLIVTHREGVACPFLYASLGDGVRSFMGTGPAATAITHNQKKTVEDVIAGTLQRFHIVDNFYFLQNHFLVFIAQK